MPYWRPDWHAFLALVPVLAAAAWLLRRRAPRATTALRELVLILALFSLWQLARVATLPSSAGAIAHARWIADAERWLRLPSEASLQSVVLPHVWLVHAADWYYLYGHFNGMGLFLVWLYWRHRARYAELRTTVVLFTAASLLVMLIPVAPPRLLPGYVDTAMRYGESVYGTATAGIADQVAAMPSDHVGWALLVAYGVIRASRSRWRWAVLAHPVLTIVAVVVTANHWWLDGVGAGLLVIAAVGVQRAGVAAWRAAHVGRVEAASPPLARV